MHKYFLFIVLIPLYVNSYEFSAMTLNAQNLFDTTDDKNKDDKAYLPIELKQSKKLVSRVIDFLKLIMIKYLN